MGARKISLSRKNLFVKKQLNGNIRKIVLLDVVK